MNTFQITIDKRPADFEWVDNPEPARWQEFEYKGDTRLALILGENQYGNMQAITADGIRSFKPHLMLDVRDVTTVGD